MIGFSLYENPLSSKIHIIAMKDYDVYLFDFDGCLCDTFKSLAYVFITSFRDFGMLVEESDVRKFSRQPLPVSYKEKGGDPAKYDEFYENLCKILNSDKNTKLSELFPDTIPMVLKLRKQGKKMGIVTSNNAPHVKDVLKLFDIDTNLFDVYVGNQECQKVKPDPDPVLSALRLLNYQGDKRKVVYIGDALDDVTAGRLAGVDYVLLDRYGEYLDYKEEKITSLEEVTNG